MIKDLELAIGYQFKNITLLQNALSHSSYANERWHDSLKSNERLEFLGDSILGMVTAEYLFRNFPERPEGELTRMRADMVCEQALANVAERIGLGQHLLLGHGEEAGGGRKRDSILADAVESLLAAVYLDGGIGPARKIIQAFVLNRAVERAVDRDYKTALQDLVQRKPGSAITYRLVRESGPDHCRLFEMEVSVGGIPAGQGEGRTKKEAEQQAAKAAIAALKE